MTNPPLTPVKAAVLRVAETWYRKMPEAPKRKKGKGKPSSVGSDINRGGPGTLPSGVGDAGGGGNGGGAGAGGAGGGGA